MAILCHQHHQLTLGFFSKMRVLSVFITTLFFVNHAHGQCPTNVDRGSATDGQTTISIIAPEAVCNAGSLWNNWHCMTLRSAANNNGVSYTVQVRWNRVGLPVKGSWFWVTGNASNNFFREGNNESKSVQDSLSTVDQVRTIEFKFNGNGTTIPPRNGYTNMSAVIADVIEYLVTNNIFVGFKGYFGSSGGSIIGANALTNHNLDQLLDGMVFGAGPFWVDLKQSCTNPSSSLYAALGMRRIIDDWNYQEMDGSTPCELQSTNPSPSYDCRSILGSQANTVFPNLMISQLVGKQDPNIGYIEPNALHFSNTITAKNKTFDKPNTPHNVLKKDFGMEGVNTVLQRIREMLASDTTPPAPPQNLTTF